MAPGSAISPTTLVRSTCGIGAEQAVRVATNRTSWRRPSPRSGANLEAPHVVRSGCVGDESSGRALAPVRVVCDGIAAVTGAMLDAYRFGTAAGAHTELWRAGFHREAVHIFGESLPPSYQRNVARLFRDAEHAMAALSIPADLAEDWAIVAAYAREAAASIEDWLVSAEAKAKHPAPARTPALTGKAPSVVHYDALARLSTKAGAQRMELAAATLLRYLDESMSKPLNDGERQVLRRLVAGVPVADVAAELGHSERSMYRELSRLWTKLGVADRSTGIRKVLSEGLID